MTSLLIKASSILIVIIALLLIAYYGVLFSAHDFNPDYLKIDACLDAGNVWDYKSRLCNTELTHIRFNQ
jgi:type III secretory pathway component EscU